MVSAPPSVRKARRAAARSNNSGGFARKAVLGVLILIGIAALAFAVLRINAALADPAERGRAALAAGDYRAAQVDLSTALAETPNDQSLRIDLARALNRLERGVEAERQLRRARDMGTDETRLRAGLARALLVQDRPADALAMLTGPVAAADATEALIVAGEASYRLGRFDAAQRAFTRAVDRGGVDAFIAVARWRLAEQDMLQAERAANQALALAPDSPEALLVRADVVLERAGPVAALPWYAAALDVQPRHVGALLGHAAALGEAGRGRAMLAPLRRAAELEPNNPHVLYLQAVLAARGGEPALARTLLSRIGGAEADRSAVLLLRAACELTLDAPVAARGAAARLVERQPDNRVARRLLALALLREDNIRGAIEVIDPITTRSDADSWSLSLLARAFGGMGWHADAVQPLERAALLAHGDPAAFRAEQVESNGSEARATIPAIRARLAAGDAAAAYDLAQSLARDNPGVPEARLLVGDAALALGDVRAAIGHYRAAADLRFDEAAMLRLVGALVRGGDTAAAQETLQAFMARWPENVAAMRIAAGMAGESGDWAQAEAYLNAAIDRTGPNDALLEAQSARARLEQGDASGALGAARRAYRLMPGNATISGVYGRALQLSGEGQGQDSADLLLKAVRLAPDDSVLLTWYGERNRR